MGDTETMDIPQIEYKAVGIAGFKSLDTDDEKGVVETYVSLTGIVDNVKDIIEPGAYTKSLATRTPKGVWHHNWHESVSRTEAIKELQPRDPELPKALSNGQPWPEEAGALYVKTRFNLNTQRGREAYEDVKFFGDQQEWSIGYNVPTGAATIDSKTGIRRIHSLDLYEYSPVLFGAMPSTHTASVKTAQLAYKTLQTAMEDTEHKADDVDDEDEEFSTVYIEKSIDDEMETKGIFGWLDEEGYFVKATSAATLSGVQAQKLSRAAYALIELLRDSTPETEDTDTGSVDELPAEEEKMDITLRELVEEAFPTENKSLIEAADTFDDAWNSEDGALMEKSAEVIADAIEQEVAGEADPDTFSDVASYITSAFDDINEGIEEEEPDEEESEDDAEESDEEETDDEEEEKSALEETETKIIDLSEFADVLEP